MNSETIIAIVGIILGSAGLFSFIQFLISRNDKKNDAIKDVKEDTKDLKDSIESIAKTLRDERETQATVIRGELSSSIVELKEEIGKCVKKQEQLELDTTRLQMMVIMTHFPDEVQRLMQIAEKYFVGLNGDWYMSSLFSGYCKKNGIQIPDWFKED